MFSQDCGLDRLELLLPRVGVIHEAVSAKAEAVPTAVCAYGSLRLRQASPTPTPTRTPWFPDGLARQDKTLPLPEGWD